MSATSEVKQNLPKDERFSYKLFLGAPFRNAIYRAYKGDTKALCDWLRSDKPLRPWERSMLADLIWRGLHLEKGKGPGRPKRKLLHSLGNLMEQRIAESINYQLRRYRKEHGLKQAPHGLQDKFIDDTMEMYRRYDQKYYSLSRESLKKHINKQ